jgi:hypothetical protein
MSVSAAAAAAAQPANGHNHLPGQAPEAPHAAQNGQRGHHRTTSSIRAVLLTRQISGRACKLIGDPTDLGGSKPPGANDEKMKHLRKAGSVVWFRDQKLVDDHTGAIVDPIPEGMSPATPKEHQLLQAQQAELARRVDEAGREAELAAQQAAERARVAEEQARAQSCCYRNFGCCKPQVVID